MREIPYNRLAAVAYARRWANARNPAYYNFDELGGDCTNFASQCLYAGCGVMNYTPDVGWYYLSLNDRSPSWTGVEFLYDFLVNNRSVGPYGRRVPMEQLVAGDLIQLGRADGSFYHTLVVLSTMPTIRIAAHTDNSLDRPLSTYNYAQARYIHIDGARTWQ